MVPFGYATYMQPHLSCELIFDKGLKKIYLIKN